jgi:hypothetical protein
MSRLSRARRGGRGAKSRGATNGSRAFCVPDEVAGRGARTEHPSLPRLLTSLESVNLITSGSTVATSRDNSNRNTPETGFAVTPRKQTAVVLSNRNKKPPPGGVANSPTKSPIPKGDKRDPSGRLRPPIRQAQGGHDDGREKLSRPEPLTGWRRAGGWFAKNSRGALAGESSLAVTKRGRALALHNGESKEPAIPQEWRRSRIEEWNEKSS